MGFSKLKNVAYYTIMKILALSYTPPKAIYIYIYVPGFAKRFSTTSLSLTNAFLFALLSGRVERVGTHLLQRFSR